MEEWLDSSSNSTQHNWKCECRKIFKYSSSATCHCNQFTNKPSSSSHVIIQHLPVSNTICKRTVPTNPSFSEYHCTQLCNKAKNSPLLPSDLFVDETGNVITPASIEEARLKYKELKEKFSHKYRDYVSGSKYIKLFDGGYHIFQSSNATLHVKLSDGTNSKIVIKTESNINHSSINNIQSFCSTYIEFQTDMIKININ